MKQLFFLLIVALASCNPKTTKTEIKKEVMTASELKAQKGIELPFLDYTEGEEPTAKPGGGNGKSKAHNVTLTVFEDLVMSGSVSCTTSPNAEWGGIQKFLALPLSNDGAVSFCNFNWSNTTAPASMDCPTSTPGVYRGWTSDKITYDVHLSIPLTIQ